MSAANDAAIELLRRQGYGNLSDFELTPDYGGPETPLERLTEIVLDAPGNFTGGLIPKVNPYNRMSPAERRQYDAGRAADVAEAVQDQIESQAEEARQQTREDDAYDTQQLFQLMRDLNRETGQQNLDLIREQGRVTTQENIRQAQAMFPLLDLAGQRGTERNLSASQRFKAFKEQLPSNIQDIMSAKQRQQESAANAFLKEAQAIATQQNAATNFANLGTNRYAGRRIA